MLYLGCPQWSSSHWKGRFFSQHCSNANMLSEYATMFNSVEGNTSFYANPKPETVMQWKNTVPDDFKFTFKLPKLISHELALQNCQKELDTWLNLFAPLFDKIGMVMLQLPASCGPEHLSRIQSFIAQLPRELCLGVEVRNLAFFRKDDNERRLNQFLMSNGINRIMMDTRPLFSEAPSTPAIEDAQRKKPRVPVNVIATGNRPMLRFVGCSVLEHNRPFYQPWLKKIDTWIAEGKEPIVFFHTADNYDAPLLARQFIQDLGIEHKVLRPFPAEQQPKQQSLL
ncbi:MULTISPECIES: DUF72 domain-containing protein [Pseudoalteromonas]|uniref:DUF72 domain-containing protein n=1 Tax=Pseudoalteromonas obscura TaxID=3048491 RepID=A0ABT7ESG8_9GAMM|nr:MULTISPECIES: DUF72 domain-containing protein [Pseudoalteromonas]MBQ4835360.1 DUF72 domain-containing protein [Pseudoalteromonas luteoviolacea]MDK2597996.1 DUF72 domain-containing protein [Pseudoalteromonas sp. P94(2023)]